MSIPELIAKALSEVGVSSVLKEQLSAIREQAATLEKKCIELERKLARAEHENRKLQDQLSARAAADQFVEHRGARFKRKPGGGYHEAVFCPNCLGTMFSLQKAVPFHCAQCKTTVNFTGRDLRRIFKELQQIP